MAVETKKSILFYSNRSEGKEFSNFYLSPIKLDGLIWPTTEHYFQAQKFPHNPKYMEEIRKAYSPTLAKKLGGSRKIPRRSDWDDIKEDVMYKAVYAKFTQHPNLRKILLDTNNAYLAEHTKYDKYWGDGGNRSGKNRLGVILMKLRENLMKE